jgi:hypothetical protein
VDSNVKAFSVFRLNYQYLFFCESYGKEQYHITGNDDAKRDDKEPRSSPNEKGILIASDYDFVLLKQ